MKFSKIVILAFILCAASGFYSSFYWSWSGLASNQTVSWDNANNAVTNGYFSARGTPPTGSKQITKSEALANYWVSPYNATLYNKSSNQLVVKQDITAADVLSTSAPLYYSSQSGHVVYGWANPCSIGTTLSVTAYYQPSLAVNTKLYADVNYGILFTDAPSTSDWFSLNGTPVKLSTYVNSPELYRYVTAVGSCASGGNIVMNTLRSFHLDGFGSPIPCNDAVNFTGTYTDHSDGLSHTWSMTYSLVSGNITQPVQVPISDFTGSALVSGDVIDRIDGGSTLNFYICSGNTYMQLTNALP